MKALLALMRHEIAERRLVAAAGLLLGLVPLVLPFLPNVPRQPTSDLRGGTALILAGLLSGALALNLGATILGRDLAERRLGFFFARPLPGWAIWGGKMAAALALAWGAGLLVLLPALLLGDLSEAGFGSLVLLGILAVLALVPFGHAVGFMQRDRSAWTLLDMLGFGVFGIAAFSALISLMRAGAIDAFPPAAGGLLAALLAALVAASLVQVVRGRTDLRRGHRALSLTLWGGLLAAVLALAGAARWVIAAPLSSLERIGGVAAAPAGSWIAVHGRAAHRGDYWPVFLVDLRNGVGHRVPALSFKSAWLQRPVFSADGRRAVWVEGAGGYEIKVADLEDGRVERRASRPFAARLSSVTLSPAGDRLATFGRGRLLIEDAVSGRLLASVPLAAEAPQVDLRFLPNGQLRVMEGVEEADGRWALEIRDLPVSGRSVPVARFPGLFPASLQGPYLKTNVQLSPDGSRLQLRREGRLQLLDIASGRELASVEASLWGGAFLPDGRWAVFSVPAPSRRRLHLFSPDGRELRSFPLPRGEQIGPLVAPELLAISPLEEDERVHPRPAESLLVDLRSGRVRSLGPGLVPVAGPGVQPGSLPARLFRRGDSELLLLDPATGALRPALRADG